MRLIHVLTLYPTSISGCGFEWAGMAGNSSPNTYETTDYTDGSLLRCTGFQIRRIDKIREACAKMRLT